MLAPRTAIRYTARTTGAKETKRRHVIALTLLLAGAALFGIGHAVAVPYARASLSAEYSVVSNAGRLSLSGRDDPQRAGRVLYRGTVTDLSLTRWAPTAYEQVHVPHVFVWMGGAKALPLEPAVEEEVRSLLADKLQQEGVVPAWVPAEWFASAVRGGGDRYSLTRGVVSIVLRGVAVALIAAAALICAGDLVGYLIRRGRRAVLDAWNSCPGCGYDIRGCVSPVCPECGHRLSPPERAKG